MASIFYVRHDDTGEFAHRNSEGEHDGKTASDIADAKEFKTWGAASDFNQNFGPKWNVEELVFGTTAGAVDMSRAIAYERRCGNFPPE